MAHFILVHGAWHGAWCWYKVLPELRARGHSVEAVDLPSHGIDHTPISEVSPAAYAARVGEALDRAGRPAVLVGHSMGGLVISLAAEHYAERVERLVYLTAFMMRAGDSLLSTISEGAGDRAQIPMVPAPDGSSVRVRDDALVDTFYADCSAADVALARACLTPQRADIFQHALPTTQARWGQVPRDYIVCEQDRAITPATQRRMIANVGCERVVSMDTSHSPFFSAPQTLAQHLATLAG